MKGHPKSYPAMQKAVAAVKCPWPEPLTRKQRWRWIVYKSILKSMAIAADAKTGEHAFVSNSMLVDQTQLSERFIRYALHDLEFSLGLITCTGNRKGGRAGRAGKGIAPEWRIELKNAAFPDYSLTGECLIEGGTDNDSRGHDYEFEGGMKAFEGGTEHGSRGHSEPLKGALNTLEGGTDFVVGGTHRDTLSESSSEPPPPPPPPPASENSGGGGGGGSSSENLGGQGEQETDSEDDIETAPTVEAWNYFSDGKPLPANWNSISDAEKNQLISVEANLGYQASQRYCDAIRQFGQIMGGYPAPNVEAKLKKLAKNNENFVEVLALWVKEKEATDLGFRGLNHPWSLFTRQCTDIAIRLIFQKNFQKK